MLGHIRFILESGDYHGEVYYKTFPGIWNIRIYHFPKNKPGFDIVRDEQSSSKPSQEDFDRIIELMETGKR